MQNSKVNATIVVFFPNLEVLAGAVKSAQKSSFVEKIILVDNGGEDRVRDFARSHKCEYIKTGANLGFGRAHNIGIKKFAPESEFYLVLNPDVVIHPGCIESLVNLMKKRPDIILSAPKVLNPDGTLQRVHKRLPGFLVLFGRRFLPASIQNLWKEDFEKYELQDLDMNKPYYLPNVSGCFMFFRSKALLELGGFDERYFMYQEDIDLSRRSYLKGPVVYWPQAQITHLWARGSHKKLKLTWMNIVSVIKYFLKWGLSHEAEPKLLSPVEISNIGQA